MTRRMRKRSTLRLDPILSEKDQDILIFLWKHRIATFEALRTFFYPDLCKKKAHRRLLRLKQGEFVKSDKMDGTRRLVWYLDTRGFKYLVANFLPELKAKTYRPQSPYHDLMVAGALLGPWKLSPPESVKIITEQELVTTEQEALPYELRKKMEHRPDGLWVMGAGNEKMAVALEVELSGKSSDRYEQICSFYTGNLFFKHVVWIVADKTLGRRIFHSSRKSGIPREDLHLFIEQKDFMERGWDCTILNESMNGISLANLLNTESGVKIRSQLESRRTHDGPSTDQRPNNASCNPFLIFPVSSTILKGLRSHSRPKNP